MDRSSPAGRAFSQCRWAIVTWLGWFFSSQLAAGALMARIIRPGMAGAFIPPSAGPARSRAAWNQLTVGLLAERFLNMT